MRFRDEDVRPNKPRPLDVTVEMLNPSTTDARWRLKDDEQVPVYPYPQFLDACRFNRHGFTMEVPESDLRPV